MVKTKTTRSESGPRQTFECFVGNSKYVRVHAGHVLALVCTYCVDVIDWQLLVWVDRNQHNTFSATQSNTLNIQWSANLLILVTICSEKEL